jgi:microcystin-dependent protein
MFAGNYAPHGWAFCDGQVLSVKDNPELFTVIGSAYGGDGKKTFALPDMRGRIPVHRGGGFSLGEAGGEEISDIEARHVPSHSHTSSATYALTSALSGGSTVTIVADPRPITTLHGPSADIAAGANSAHDNMQPYLALHYIVALHSGAEATSTGAPLIGEVRIFAGKHAPTGWKRCDGQTLSIEDNTELFSVLGTTYGGDGRNAFNLPDLRSRATLHAGQGEGLTLRKLGEQGGSDAVALSESQLPHHSHQIGSPEPGTVSGSLVISSVAGGHAYASTDAGEPHNNMQPYLALNYYVAVRGLS